MNIKRIISLLVFLFALVVANESFAADKVIRCDNCQNPEATALAEAQTGGGIGVKLIADYSFGVIYAYNVEFDAERGNWIAIPNIVPESIQQAFNLQLQIINSAGQLRIESEGSGGAVVTIYADNRSGNNFNLPDQFINLDAYETIWSASTRSSLESGLAAAASGANSPYPIWNGIAYQLSSMSLSVLGAISGIDAVNIRIVWKNGSESVFKIEAGSVHIAKYVPGQSKDSSGNRIADAAVTDPDPYYGGPSYVGEYTNFPNNESLENWLWTAHQHGVTITNGSGGGRSMTCSWDGTTLTCIYVIQ